MSALESFLSLSARELEVGFGNTYFMMIGSGSKIIISASSCRRAPLAVLQCRHGHSSFKLSIRQQSRRSLKNDHIIQRWASNSQSASSTSDSTAANNNNHHQPPLLGRIALVSCTTALATPAFPALGFLYAILRITVPDTNARKLMEGRWGTLLSFTTWTLLPNLYSGAVTSLILPCAISNALVAGCSYGIIDVVSGGPKGNNNAALLLQTPWITGAGIGATVGYIAPNQVYGPVMEYCWQIEGMSQSMNYIMSVPFATEVSVATGAVAGMILHPLLYYPIHGINGIHWGFPLAAVTSALYFIYYGREESGLPVPEGSYVDRSDLELVESILRYNNTSGEIETYSLKSEQFIGSVEKCFEGREIAESSRSYSSASSWGSSNKVVFDDRLLAFVYNYWDVKTATRYPDHVVSNIPSKSSLQMKQDSMLVTDASVATLLHKNDLEAIQTALDDVDGVKTSSDGVKQSSAVDLKAQNEVNIALELLMLLRQVPKEEDDGVLQKQYKEEIPKLEKYIRRKRPQIVLYTNDEECKGESVESQLRNCDWKTPKDLSNALEQWHRVQEESYRSWRNKAMLASSVVLSIGCSLLLSR